MDWDESRELFDSEVNVSEAGVPGSVSTEGRAGRVQHGGFGCLLVLPKRVLVLPVVGRKEARVVTRALQPAQSFPSTTAQNLLLAAGASDAAVSHPSFWRRLGKLSCCYHMLFLRIF